MSEIIKKHETPNKPKSVIGHWLSGAIHSPATGEPERHKVYTINAECLYELKYGSAKNTENEQ